MARPALSASRATDILDLFAAFPGRTFTMSEIMKATGVNVASCHAVLSVLLARGYLEKRQKEYRLGRALVALGQAAEQTHPLVRRAQKAAEALRHELRVAVLLSTLAGEEILALSSLRDEDGRSARLQTGQRIRMVPPNGVHFVAWGSSDLAEEWLERSQSKDECEIAQWRRSIELTRKRGYQVTLRREQTPEFADLMSHLAQGSPPLAYRSEGARIADHGWTLEQPEAIMEDAEYSVALIAAPIFDQQGDAVLSLSLGGFVAPLTGVKIRELAEHLLGACLQVMREDRGG
jgi:DNA-binding IclR family transcriptional regulator